MENIVADLFAAKEAPGASHGTNFKSNINPANIKVVGVGRGGRKKKNKKIRSGLSGIEL